MNTYEKIITAIILVLILAGSIFSYSELQEDSYTEILEGETSDFDKSFGPRFSMLNFTTTVSSETSPEREENCQTHQLVLVSVLYNIAEQVESFGKNMFGDDDSFQVNQETLDTLCAQTAQITLKNDAGDTLTINKDPFVRKIPQGGDDSDIGTQVQIRAAITPADPSRFSPQTFTSTMTIPDKLLE